MSQPEPFLDCLASSFLAWAAGAAGGCAGAAPPAGPFSSFLVGSWKSPGTGLCLPGRLRSLGAPSPACPPPQSLGWLAFFLRTALEPLAVCSLSMVVLLTWLAGRSLFSSECLWGWWKEKEGGGLEGLCLCGASDPSCPNSWGGGGVLPVPVQPPFRARASTQAGAPVTHQAASLLRLLLQQQPPPLHHLRVGKGKGAEHLQGKQPAEGPLVTALWPPWAPGSSNGAGSLPALTSASFRAPSSPIWLCANDKDSRDRLRRRPCAEGGAPEAGLNWQPPSPRSDGMPPPHSQSSMGKPAGQAEPRSPFPAASHWQGGWPRHP